MRCRTNSKCALRRPLELDGTLYKLKDTYIYHSWPKAWSKIACITGVFCWLAYFSITHQQNCQLHRPDQTTIVKNCQVFKFLFLFDAHTATSHWIWTCSKFHDSLQVQVFAHLTGTQKFHDSFGKNAKDRLPCIDRGNTLAGFLIDGRLDSVIRHELHVASATLHVKCLLHSWMYM